MSFKIEYGDLLRRFLAESNEIDLLHAYELGKELQHRQVSPDELIGIHLEALDRLPRDLSDADRLRETHKSFLVLLETMIAYGIAYAEGYRLLEQAAREAEEAKFELERAIVEIDLANEQLKDLDRMKNQFYAHMSHELRTPLNAILGFAEDTLAGRAGPISERQTSYVQKIFNAGSHLLRVINDILDLAKLQSGRTGLEWGNFSLTPVLDEVAGTVEGLLQRKHQTLSLPDTTLPMVYGDHARVFQILLNLVSNAIKFTPDGGRIAIDAAADGERLTIAVRDTGVGIPEEALEQIYEDFRQIQTPGQPRQQGTGLGLAIVKRLVEMHGGAIDVTSAPGQGTEFRFSLPRARAED